MTDDEPRSFWGSCKRGAWLGFKWTSLIVGPLAAAMQLLGFGLVGYWIAAGRFWSIPLKMVNAVLFGPIGMYLSSCLWGCLAGVVVLGVMHPFRRGRRGNDGDEGMGRG